MTPGQEALAEAARLEAARVYTRTVPEHRQPKAQPARPVLRVIDGKKKDEAA